MRIFKHILRLNGTTRLHRPIAVPDGVRPDAETVVLDSARYGLAQIAECPPSAPEETRL